MSAPSDDLYDVEAEVTLVESSHPQEATELPVSEWLFDPTDAEREEIGLRGLLDAVEALEDESRPSDHGA
ncbi:hypothetical protein [Nonomuraea jabiensis]|uniref:hypothetical protein n=1 Tax=Nonomuraea jabiensis TaxID=882448 RepID=UPI003D7023FF